MTEHTISSQAYREFMSARERTAYWVQHYDPEDVYSPSMAPTDLDYFAPPSPAMSTHSLPPKMVLRYNDGRGDIPIPRAPGGGPGSRSSHKHRPQGHHHSSRSTSHTSSPLAGGHSPHGDQNYCPPITPEEIRVLPSRSSNPSSNSPNSASSRHNRSKSVPRHAIEQDVPFITPPVPRSHTPQPNAQAPYSPWVHGSRHGSASKQPPSIVYAPGRHHGPNYEPPLVLHHQPQMGPNGMIYSHSAPPIMQGGPAHYPPLRHRDDPYGDPDRLCMGRSGEPRRSMRGRQPPPPNRKRSSDTLGSQESGSTYYVLPSAGQKVHVISASPERSIDTASSSTKAATSPYAHSSSGSKKPFFGRLLAKFAHPSHSKAPTPPDSDRRKLHRRHSVGASGRPKLVVQRA